MTTTLLRNTLAALLIAVPAGVTAQQDPTNQYSAPPTPALLPHSSLDVLYDQMGNPGTQNFPSQEFEESRTQYNSQGADDFVVPEGLMWSISEVSVMGAYREDEGPATNVDVRFYLDEGGQPGRRVLSYSDLSVDTDVDGDLVVTLSPSALLAGGTYWVSVLADMDALVEGQWFWTKQATPEAIGGELHWRNPGNGFGLDCTDWQPLNSVCGDDGGFDASFQLAGEARVSFVGFEQEALTDSLEAGESALHTVTLLNDSDRAATYAFASIGGALVANVEPTQGEIPAGGATEVTVTIVTDDEASPGAYVDTLEATVALGIGSTTLRLPVEVVVPVTVASEEGAAPQAFALRGAYPNPFVSETVVDVLLPESGVLRVEVFDVRGRRVAVLVDGLASAGPHRLVWDARTATSGTYIVRAWAGAAAASLPVALVR